ncbi:MAG: hypothetical protein M1829_001858 [Trizodia sp. TS-e1964]|nr:MAG: hypothetical protein M1829_001858 [Trizodia sp. TS-e1964]
MLSLHLRPLQRLPPTPPEYRRSVFYRDSCPLQSGMPYAPHTATQAPQEKTAFENNIALRSPEFAASLIYHHRQPNMPPVQFRGLPPPGLLPPGLTHPSQPYGPSTAPTLPPTRAPVYLTCASVERALEQTRPNPPPLAAKDTGKEEKPTGGVAAQLDYEMEQMTEFVSEMTQGMYDLFASGICLQDIDIIRSVQPTHTVSPAFRKFVVQILTATRLPCSTILLALYYLSRRMTLLNESGNGVTPKITSAEVFRMLTISLQLASKFLDDNTFQNRSWSDVTGLDVHELNTLELEWVMAAEWNLFVDMETPGFRCWMTHWSDYKLKDASKTLNALKLTPLDTNVYRHQYPNKSLSPTPLYFSNHGQAAENPHPQYPSPNRYELSARLLYPWSAMTDRSPPPLTGSNTPEYFALPGSWSFNTAPPPYTTRPMQPPGLLPTIISSQPPSYHHTPYSQFYNQNIWSAHSAGCSCHYCPRSVEPYILPPGYRQQSVMG